MTTLIFFLRKHSFFLNKKRVLQSSGDAHEKYGSIESLFIVYLSLSSHINTLNKKYKYLKELIKITYDSL